MRAVSSGDIRSPINGSLPVGAGPGFLRLVVLRATRAYPCDLV
jgi:hypothetical protein